MLTDPFCLSWKQPREGVSEGDENVECSIGGSDPIIFLIDSGAEVDVLSEQDWEKLKTQYKKDEVVLYDIDNESKRKIMAYAGSSPLKILCTFSAWTEIKREDKPRSFAKFFVIGGGGRSLLSRRTAIRMKILKLGLQVNNVTARVPEGNETTAEPAAFPSIPGEVADFDVDESVQPTKNAYYHVPAAYCKRANERLSDMESQGIIERVERAPKWISGMSAVPKGASDFRLVVNMKGPNKAIRRQFHLLPRMDEMKRKLYGASWFSKLDLKNAFYHIPLSEASKEMTTFMTESGMFRFKRLVFGVNCAPEIFQRAMERILQGQPGTIVFIDDILIYADTLEALRDRTKIVLGLLQANNLTLNPEKCEYEKEHIKFLGHELTKEGMSMDRSKVEAIKKFREPKSSSELRSFLGLATYVSPFIPRYSDITAPLWKAATMKNFAWNDELQEAFENTKKAVINCTITQGYFSDTDLTILYTDASPHALGAVMVQENNSGESRIICFASKSLTATEQRYAQTQREALAIVWGVEHYYYFLLGRAFIIRTDAQGVAFIFRRDRESPKRVMSRADGWALRLSAYSFTIEYIKGSYNIADPSSRLYKGSDEPYTEANTPFKIGSISAEINETQSERNGVTMKDIKEATEADQTMQEVRKAIESGIWPQQLNRYKLVAEDLRHQNGILTKAGAVIMPMALRELGLALAHEGHPGETAMKSILRARLWWPGMSKQVEDWVKTCKSCVQTSRKDPPVPMKRSKLPQGVWDMLAIDFNGPYAKFGGIYIFTLVDCFSRYLMASVVKSTDFGSVKAVLEVLFKRNGRPERIKSDNGPPFNGHEYGDYCEHLGIEVVFITPLHPQQNGMSERYMQVINKAMQIAVVEGKPYGEMLASSITAHNSAKHRITQVAPEELMFARKLRRDLPLFGNSSVNIDMEELRFRDEYEKSAAKMREDAKRRATSTAIMIGDSVVVLKTTRAKGDPKFGPTPFKVVAKHHGDLELIAEDGQTLKRNVTHVKKLRQRISNETDDLPETPNEVQTEGGNNEANTDLQPRQQESKRKARETEPLRRSARIAKTPAHLSDFIRQLRLAVIT